MNYRKFDTTLNQYLALSRIKNGGYIGSRRLKTILLNKGYVRYDGWLTWYVVTEEGQDLLDRIQVEKDKSR